MERLPGLTIYDLTERELLIYRERVEQMRKTPLVAWLLWFFTGGLGGHRYYFGHTGYAIGMTLTLGGLGIWALIDAFFIPRALRTNLAEVGAVVLQEIAALRSRE